MRRISDTIARLAAMQAQRASSTGGLKAQPDRLSALTGFGSNPGALKAQFYLPEHLPHGAPLVVVLHGCTQNAAGYDHHAGWSRLADEAGFAVLYPEQQRSNNPNLCFNWFQPEDVRREGGEALSIRQMIETMVEAHGLDRKRIFITGLSAGGAMACAMLASYPELFSAGAIISGIAFASATTVPEAFDRMRGHGGPSDKDLRRRLRDASSHRGPWPRVSIWQGTADQTVAASNAEAIATQWWGVHQIEQQPTHSSTDGRHGRTVWCDAAGAPVMEINTIAGMGHGTPIDPESLGAPGPYMLDVGISSTQEIALFWGLLDADARPASRPRQKNAERISNNASRPAGGSRSTKAPQPAPSPASNVQKIIEDALRAAGLTR